ncbi:MAG: DNA-formamidopyrimidine glycosylase [Chloroflexi bacterium]|jgi:formamidopyrimidine-DNA glycosylase|nr:DNA-formamidopyrimidine glycosylase [Chloroflexota bacterium]
MPELPEVETVVRDLRPEVAGRTIVAVPRAASSVIRYPAPEALAALLPGGSFDSVRRQGKYILCGLSREGGPAGEALIVHLGMTGHLEVCDAAAPERPHTHLRARLDDGRELRFADARRFGRVMYGDPVMLSAARLIPRLGVEPLGEEFTPARLDAVLRGTTRTLKAALLDQRGIAGLGNIYVDEICHRAGVRPTRRCPRLTRRERAALHAAVISVLQAAIRNRGSTIDDYRDLWNARGGHQEELRVYGRGGSSCMRCGEVLRRTVVAGRGTTYCPACQR